jgi:hypothetical protein
VLIDEWRLAIADRPTADCRLPIADCRLPIADCRLLIAELLIADSGCANRHEIGNPHYIGNPQQIDNPQSTVDDQHSALANRQSAVEPERQRRNASGNPPSTGITCPVVFAL